MLLVSLLCRLCKGDVWLNSRHSHILINKKTQTYSRLELLLLLFRKKSGAGGTEEQMRLVLKGYVVCFSSS